MDFEIKTVKRDKEGHYMVIKGSIQEEDITLMNIYAPNIDTSIHKANANKYEREISSNKIIAVDFNTPLTRMNRSTKQKITKEAQTLSDIMDQLDLIDIYIGHFSPKQ